MIRALKNKKITILGAGRSGIGIAKLLKSNNYKVFLSDSMPKEKLKYLDENILKEYSIEYEFGNNSDKIFNTDILVVSPGISPSSDIIKRATAQNIKILSEIEVSSYFCNAPIIAITGTNGKTTTTELTGSILREAGFDVHVCGNVGLAFSEVIPKLDSKSIVVLEVSSFQLEYINEFRPKVAMILNITKDHLDWHGNFDNYVNAKLRIHENQKEDDLMIINLNDKLLRNKIPNFHSHVGAFSNDKIANKGIKYQSYIDNDYLCFLDKTVEKIIKKEEIILKGNHNVMNALAAILAVKKFNVNNDIIYNVLKNFSGVEHRIEFVRDLNGVKYFNDSKATNYDSLYVALESFDRNVILIMGGKDGANNFEKVDEFIKTRVKYICAIGQNREIINNYYKSTKEVYSFKSLETAVEYVKNNSNNGDSVLFSPGYKSFDMFDNFEHRGEVFKKIVNNLE